MVRSNDIQPLWLNPLILSTCTWTTWFNVNTRCIWSTWINRSSWIIAGPQVARGPAGSSGLKRAPGPDERPPGLPEPIGPPVEPGELGNLEIPGPPGPSGNLNRYNRIVAILVPLVCQVQVVSNNSYQGSYDKFINMCYTHISTGTVCQMETQLLY